MRKIILLIIVIGVLLAPTARAASSPFRACQGVLQLTEGEYAKLEVTPDIAACVADQQIQILPQMGFLTSIARKLGSEQETAGTQAGFLGKVGVRAAVHVARNNAITEVVIHCARKDYNWIDERRDQGEIFDSKACPKLLSSMRKVTGEAGPSARIARTLMEAEQSRAAKLKNLVKEFQGVNIPLSDLPYLGLGDVKIPGLGLATEARQELTDGEKDVVRVEQEKTAQMAKDAFLAFQMKVEEQFENWNKNPVGPAPHPMMRKYAKSKARENVEAARVLNSRLVEHSRAYGAALQKAPVLAFLPKSNLEDNDADNELLAAAAEKVLANGKKDAEHLKGLNAEIGMGGTEAFKRRVELLKYGNVVDEILRENPADCNLATAAADYVRQLDKAKQAIIYTGMAVSMLLPVVGPELAALAPSLPVLTAAASLTNVVSAGLAVSYYASVYDSYQEFDRLQQRSLATLHTDETELGAGVPVSDVAEYLEARDALVTQMAFAAISAAQQAVQLTKAVSQARVKFKNSRALNSALEAKGMSAAERASLFRDLESGNKDLVQKATLELMTKLKIDEEEIRMMKLMLSRNMISDLDEAALANVNKRLKNVPLKDRPALYARVNGVLEHVKPELINSGNRALVFDAALAGTRFGVSDPKRLAAVINEWGSGLDGLTRAYEVGKQQMSAPGIRSIKDVVERRNAAFVAAVEELAERSPAYHAMNVSERAAFMTQLKEGCVPR